MTHDDASTILVVEDDDATRTFLADNLAADGYDLLVADCAADGLRLLERKFPDLALVDLGLPDASGFELLRRVRASDGVANRLDPDMPLMVVSGRATELDRVRGFDRGADDYVVKPFSYPGERVPLSQKEFALLRTLVSEPTRVFTKEELLRSIWGFRSMGSTRTLDSHACRLRHKLATRGDRFVVNVWGVGYRLVDAPVLEARARSLSEARAR